MDMRKLVLGFLLGLTFLQPIIAQPTATILSAKQVAGYDADAQAFITATGISGANATAINNLVVALKAASIWTKFYVIYPFIGGTSTTHKYNLIDPRDLDAAYRGVFNGSWTHNANGVTPAGASTSYLDTKLNGSTVLSAFNSSWAFYSKTNTDCLCADYGDNVDEEILPDYLGTLYHDAPRTIDRFTIASQTDTRGFYNGNMNASNVIVYKNGTSIGSKGSAVGHTYSNTNMVFGAGYSSLSRWSVRTLSFAAIGQYLDATQAAAFNTAVEAYEDELSRGEVP